MKSSLALACGLTLMAAAFTARAQSDSSKTDYRMTPVEEVTASTTKGPFYNQSEGELRARKLARGAANVVLCVGEIPNQMFQEAYKTSPVTGVVVGAWKGVVKGSKRLVVGLWEIATFYAPTKNNYKPYVEPEVVFEEYLH